MRPTLAARDGDLLLVMGAGDIGAAANELHRDICVRQSARRGRSTDARHRCQQFGRCVAQSPSAAAAPSAEVSLDPPSTCSRPSRREASTRMRSTVFPGLLDALVRRPFSRACSTSCMARRRRRRGCRARSIRSVCRTRALRVLGSALAMDKIRTKQVWNRWACRHHTTRAIAPARHRRRYRGARDAGRRQAVARGLECRHHARAHAS